MHTNALKEGVNRGDLMIGTWVNMIRNPAILTLLKNAGLDFARIDMEHSGIGIESLTDMAVHARALNFPIAVRMPHANREWITRVLDCGVWNLHCPQVENAAHAKEIAEASHYFPAGNRGMSGSSPSSEWEAMPAGERLKFANEQVHVTVMFETDEAFNDLDEIAATPGIDALTLGPSDLAQNLGIFGKPEMGKIIDERRDMILAACKKHNKGCAMLVGSQEQARQWKEAGVLMVVYKSEVEILSSGYRDALKSIRA